jgi:hypothetical protein
MSFLQKAREAANTMAEQAKAAADKAGDKDTQDKFKQQVTSGVGIARKGMKSVIDRIDPGTLAEVIIKATAIQEMANRALREKGSPYRISEISITATIPPGVNFAIGRIDDPEKLTGQEVASTELVASGATEPEAILSLTGETDIAELVEAVEEDVPG